jgi:phosphonopyruvate decarboxylase
MIMADVFVNAAKERGFALWSGVPCSYLKPFINYVIDDPEARYVAAANEGDAVAIASGSALAGTPAIVMFQNSGLGNAVNPLTSLSYIFKIPVLLITTLRGEPGGPHDEPQHALMGPITTRMLDLMEVRWEYFPVEEAEVRPSLDRACAHMKGTGLPFAFVMKKDSVGPWPLKTKPVPRRAAGAPHRAGRSRPASVTRTEMLKALRAAVRPEDAVLATTGFTGRELYALEDSENQLYMVGSMGCVSSLGLGMALAQPKRRVVAVDGDGAVLMRMGALSTIGYERPPNLVHIVLDNGAYESTGDQATLSGSTDLPAVAAACGYFRTREVTTPGEFAAAIVEHRNDGLTFIRARILSGVPDGLPRPKVTPEEVARRLERFLLKDDTV